MQINIFYKSDKKGIDVTGIYDTDTRETIIKKGSKIRATDNKGNQKENVKKLISEGIIKDGSYQEDYKFASSSAAFLGVNGIGSSGPQHFCVDINGNSVSLLAVLIADFILNNGSSYQDKGGTIKFTDVQIKNMPRYFGIDQNKDYYTQLKSIIEDIRKYFNWTPIELTKNQFIQAFSDYRDFPSENRKESQTNKHRELLNQFNKTSNMTNNKNQNPYVVFQNFYENKKSEFKQLFDENLMNDFLKRWPLNKFNDIKLNQYVQGLGKQDTLSYELEHGKYKNLGIGIGGGTASKFGIYYNKEKKAYVTKKYKDGVDDPEKAWDEIKGKLIDFFDSVGTAENPEDIREDESLQGMNMVLCKLASYYFPDKIINIASRERLMNFMDFFGIQYNDKYTGVQLAFLLKKEFKKQLPNLLGNDHDFMLGSGLVLFRDRSDKNMGYTKQDFLKDVFITSDQYDDIKNLLERKKNIILQGAPGVGKTYMARRLAYSLMGNKDNDKIGAIQFHQSYAYEDFIEGNTLKNNSVEPKKGIFYKFCKKAEEDPQNNYYFIIDEINRGNLSKIFGELLMLIENDKRGKTSLNLAYSDEPFSVPENLYIIGMMNTADRSLALLDYALRRRFSFVDVEPAFESENTAFDEYKLKVNNSSFNEVTNLIMDINKTIEDDDSLGKGFRIGHSYFCGLDGKSDSEIRDSLISTLKYDIIPMLREYWFDEPRKLEEVEGKINDLIDKMR